MQLINSAIYINKVTIRDTFIPLAANRFSENFAIDKILLLLDFFLGYN